MQPRGLGANIFNERYALHENETWEQASQRVASTVATAESGADRLVYGEKFFHAISEGLFMPGGRVWYGAGRPLSQLLNCFVIPTGDSREAWGKAISDMLVTSGMGGGVGTNFSTVRPRGYPIHRMGGKATGSVSLMRMFNSVGDELVGGGNRRLALMEALNLDHPDVNEFINAKLDTGKMPDWVEQELQRCAEDLLLSEEALEWIYQNLVKGQLTNANVSVIIPDDMPTEDFIQAVRDGKEIPLRFNRKDDILGRTINAKELWETIVRNALRSGEPGILNGYLANHDSNLHYAYPLICTNPCGEIWLPAYGCCDLGALVLPSYVRGGKLDYELLDENVRLGVRFLDDVLDVSNYPIPEIQEVCQNERRIGLGVMGLHSMLLDLGYTYDSDESFQFVGNLFRRIRNTAYRASIELAKEKGTFAIYDERFTASKFVRRLPESIREDIKEHGIRNCALLTIAPTGTTSMVHGVTSGIEPLFAPVYLRRRYVETEEAGKLDLVETLVVHKDYLDHGDLAQGAYDITVSNHLKMQRAIQPFIDNAVSKTINVSAGTTEESVSEEVLEALTDCKGITLYMEGSRPFEPLKALRKEEINDYLVNWNGEIDYDGLDSDDCPTGICTI